MDLTGALIIRGLPQSRPRLLGVGVVNVVDFVERKMNHSVVYIEPPHWKTTY